MERTALMVGGFTQPSLAKRLIQFPASIEEVLHRGFLWLFPKSSFSMLESLETVDERFCCYLGEYKLSKGVVVGMYIYWHHSCG